MTEADRDRLYSTLPWAATVIVITAWIGYSYLQNQMPREIKSADVLLLIDSLEIERMDRAEADRWEQLYRNNPELKQ